MPTLRLHLLAGFGVCALASAILIVHGPILQDQSYHVFADHRSWLGIPNAGDVLSNLAFAIAALAGVPVLRRARWADPRDRWAWAAYAATLLLTALGSTYYHVAPGDARLFWDRLPLSLTLAALAAAIIGERLPPGQGRWLLGALLPLAAMATGWWRWSGDLRPYALAQFLPLLLIAWLSAATPSRYDRSRDPLIAAVFYGVAKLGERFDAEILAALHGVVSGHTLKHLAAALGGWWLLRMVRRRHPVVALPLALREVSGDG